MDVIDINTSDEKPTKEEIANLVKAEDVEELIAEDYLAKLLKGDELKFRVYKLTGRLNGCTYTSFNLSERLWHIYETIHEAIKRRNLNLKFEYEAEMWATNYKEDEFCDNLYNEFRRYKDSGLLIHNYM